MSEPEHMKELKKVLQPEQESREAYLGKSPVPADVRFTIEEIRIVEDDNERRQARVRVLVTFGKSSWHKNFGFPVDGIIEFETMRARLREAVGRDFRIDRAISELVAAKGKSYPLFDD